VKELILQHNTVKNPEEVAVKKMYFSNYLSGRQSSKVYCQNIRGLRRKAKYSYSYNEFCITFSWFGFIIC
jgi:hypothetical protein